MLAFSISYRDASGYRKERVHADDERAARSLWCQCHDDGFITGVIRDVEA